MVRNILINIKKFIYEKPLNWIKQRAQTIRFYSTVFIVLLFIGILASFSFSASDFTKNFALNLLTELIGALVVIYLLEGYLNRTSEEMQKEQKVLRKSWDEDLLALDREEISWNKAKQSNQWLSWYKWTQRGDKTGWYELWEDVRYGDGLSPRVRWATEWELERVRKKAYQVGVFSSREEELEENLQALLEQSANSTDAVSTIIEQDQVSQQSAFLYQPESTRWFLGIAILGMLCALAGLQALLSGRRSME